MMAPTKKVLLYTRAGCHLCEVVYGQLERLRAELAFELEPIDVDSDSKLQELYGLEVPVVMLDGKKVAKYRLDEQLLRRRLRP
jgi:glutaredoxin